MDYAREFVYASNPLRLTVKQWLAVGLLLATVLLGVPFVAARLEPFSPGQDYRLPYDFSQDYWHSARWFRTAAQRGSVVLLGDSVVWGEYVGAGQALSGQLNRLAGTERFANLGVNGLHPAALLGLLRDHGEAIRDGDVILVLNTLWMSSARHDLREAPAAGEEAQASFNHPALVPQFWPRVPRYRAGFEERVGVVVERRLAFLEWVTHLNAKSAYANALGAAADAAAAAAVDAGAGTEPEPRIDNPAPKPYRGLFIAVPPPAPGPHGQPVTWEARGIPVSTLAWPAPSESLQWRFFGEAVTLLQARGNRVCVLVAPFNPYLQDPESRARYERMVAGMVTELSARRGVTVIEPPPLPTTEYADASHPLAAGYARLARELAADARFRPWFGAVAKAR
jgi:lysophospholipase L1-like esterase